MKRNFSCGSKRVHAFSGKATPHIHFQAIARGGICLKTQALMPRDKGIPIAAICLEYARCPPIYRVRRKTISDLATSQGLVALETIVVLISPATRAKAQILLSESFSGLKSPLRRTKIRG